MTDNLRDIALRQAAACAREKYAGEEKRIERAYLLAINNAVLLGADGIDRIRSDRHPEVYYEVRNGRCDCPDAGNAPDLRCKHKIAAWLTRIARDAIRRTA